MLSHLQRQLDIKFGDPVTSELSNLYGHPFTFRHVEYGSMEGLLQSLKHKERDNVYHIAGLYGYAAREYSRYKMTNATLYFMGQPVNRLSRFYTDLVHEAYEAMYLQNPLFREKLKATKGYELDHSLGNVDPNITVLTRAEFLENLYRLRG